MLYFCVLEWSEGFGAGEEAQFSIPVSLSENSSLRWRTQTGEEAVTILRNVGWFATVEWVSVMQSLKQQQQQQKAVNCDTGFWQVCNENH